MSGINWLASTIGKRGYIADYLRSASPDGSRITGTGCDTHTIGFMSCDSSYKVRSIDEQGYIDDVLSVCEKDSISAILTMSDLDVRAISAHRDMLADKGIVCFFPTLAAAEIFGDKWLTYSKLTQDGFAVPMSWMSLDEAITASPNFPLIVKPRMGSASFGVSVVANMEQLATDFANTEKAIIQQYLQGRLINVEVCSDANGHPLAGSVWERLSSVDGETALAKTIEHPAALDLVLRLLKKIPVAGPIDVDLIEVDGSLFLIEVNTRFGGGYPVSHLAGADFPGAMVRSMSGTAQPDFDRYRRDVVMMKSLVPMEFDSSVVKAC